ncbi:unnamed protein product [Tuber melanosporum]|uniref:(Perigord truffle) hypothetical protein n=1 Tax=Tuber melanosporum (strain Mel28) TaxID=656061 RepID=D5GMT5_TUBMM|nr:uncharacterized protein GSTUM_00010923001 [Tuber melanosporum]CAZ85828.1 unnamed protein product [Tuber melanosporum]
MTDQWVDSLSEDWVSQPRSSPSNAGGGVVGGTMRSNFSSGTTRVLHERNHSSVNSTTGHWRRNSTGGNERKETPEWKRKLLEDFGGPGGKDLFSPIQLESMFQPPPSHSSSVIEEQDQQLQQKSKKPGNRSLIPIPTNTLFGVGLSVLREEDSRQRINFLKDPSSPHRKNSSALPKPKKISMLKQGMHRRGSSTPSLVSDDVSMMKGKRKTGNYAGIENDVRSRTVLPGDAKSGDIDKVESKIFGTCLGNTSEEMKKDESISPVFTGRLGSLKGKIGLGSTPVRNRDCVAGQESQILPISCHDNEAPEMDDTLGEMMSSTGASKGRKPFLPDENDTSVYPSSPPVVAHTCSETSQFGESELEGEEDYTFDGSENDSEKSAGDLGSPFASPIKACPQHQSQEEEGEKTLASPFVSNIEPSSHGSTTGGFLGEAQSADGHGIGGNTILDNIRRHKNAPKSPLKNALSSSVIADEDDPFISSYPSEHHILPAPRTPPIKAGEVRIMGDSKSSGSPLKLFHSNYDTYTNEKLVKRLGELEDNVAEKPKFVLPQVAVSQDEHEDSWQEEGSTEFSGGSIVVNRLEAMARRQEKEKSPSRNAKRDVAYTKAVIKSHRQIRTTTTTTTTTTALAHHRHTSAPESAAKRVTGVTEESLVEGGRKHRRWKSDESATVNDGILAPISPVKERTPKRLRRSNSGGYGYVDGPKAGRLLSAGCTPGRTRRISPEVEEGSLLLSSSRPRSRASRTPGHEQLSRTPASKSGRRIATSQEVPTPSSRDRLPKVPVLEKDYNYGASNSADFSLANGSPLKGKSCRLVFCGSRGDPMEDKGFGMPQPRESETLRKGSVTTQDFLLQAEEVMDRIRGMGLRSRQSNLKNPGAGGGEGESFNSGYSTDSQIQRNSPTRNSKMVGSSSPQAGGTEDSFFREVSHIVTSKNPLDPHSDSRDIHHDTLNTQSSISSQGSNSSVEVITPGLHVNHPLALKGSAEMTFDQKSMAWVGSRTPDGGVSDSDPFLGISDLSVNSQEEAQALEMARKQWEGMTSDEEKSGVWRSSRLILDVEDDCDADLTGDGTEIWESRPWFGGENISTVGTGSGKSRSAGTGTETRVTSFGSHESKPAIISGDPTASGSNERNVPGKKVDGEGKNGKEERSIRSEEELPRPTELGLDDQCRVPEPIRRRQVSYAEDYSSPTTASMMRQSTSSPKEVPESWDDGDDSCLDAGVDGFLDHGSLRQTRRSSRIFSSGGTYRGAARRRSGGNKSFVGRPISRIKEEDEETVGVEDISRSLRRISLSSSLTPLPTHFATYVSSLPPSTVKKTDVSFHMTPLADISYHYETTEALINLELSFLATRRGPKASAKSIEASFSIAQENLIKTLTDVEPYEPYWEWMKFLKLADRKMETLHTLNEWCQRIEELDVSNNQLGQLSGVPENVKDLKAASNCLSSITHFGHLFNLQYLDISRNGLENLDGLRNLKHLRELKVDENSLESLEGVLNMDGLASLRARRNKLTTVSFEKASMKRLTELDLRGNNMEAISGLDNLPALIHLNLDQNKLCGLNIPNGVRLNSLRSIKLTQNYFETFDVSQYPNLRILYIDNNRLKDISGLSRAKQLDSISTREQDVKEFTIQYERMFEARKIYLSGNPLRDLSFRLDFLNLQYLELASAQLTSLPENFGYLVCNTRVLNLNNNAISDLRPLLGVVRLKKLLLVGNRVKSVKKAGAVLAHFQSLSYLDLRMNPLTIGFYPASSSRRSLSSPEDPDEYIKDPFTMVPGDTASDRTFQAQMDLESAVTRRRYEITIGQKCPRMKELDGLEFRVGELWREDHVLEELKNRDLVRTGDRGN